MEINFLLSHKCCVNDDIRWGKQDLPTGFAWGHARMEENSLRAPNGDELNYQGMYLRKGNHLDVWARIENNVEVLNLNQFSPQQELVIATCCGCIKFFAPVCRSKKELIEFLYSVQNVDDPWLQQCKDLALWLYKNNPNKIQEEPWGI